jgi:hypothetical protein
VRCSLCRTLLTVTACHRPPAGVSIPRSLSTAAAARADIPANSDMIGRNRSARASASSLFWSDLRLVPPSLTPRFFAACRARRVRSPMTRRSRSARRRKGAAGTVSNGEKRGSSRRGPDRDARLPSRAPRAFAAAFANDKLGHAKCGIVRHHPATLTPQKLPKIEFASGRFEHNILKSLALPRGLEPLFRRERANSRAPFDCVSIGTPNAVATQSVVMSPRNCSATARI